MSDFYILWENQTANMVGDFDTEEDVYAFLRRNVAEFGRDAVSTLLLVRARNDDDSDVTDEEFVAEGSDLVDRALADLPSVSSSRRAGDNRSA
ncbi:MAG: hypothetical protein IT334_01505 [Thermomicrobiales bacterium]|nr:hypothetical protein [Thermomicrobiales bacterium]